MTITPDQARHLEQLALQYQEAVHQHRQAAEEEDIGDEHHNVQHALGLLIGAAYTYIGDQPGYWRFADIAGVMQNATEHEHTELYAGILGSIQALTDRNTP